MPPITAVLHTENDALRLGRCLETLYPCDEVLIIDHTSRDATVETAREYGARVMAAYEGATPDHYLKLARPGWILCLDPRESVTESLAASLFEWKTHPEEPEVPAFSFLIREETIEGWIAIPNPQTRLVPQDWNQWDGVLPQHDSSATMLEGELLRFAFP